MRADLSWRGMRWKRLERPHRLGCPRSREDGSRMDTTFAIVRRYRGGVPIFKPDRGHLHHRLLDLGFTQRQAVLLMYVISAMLGLSAVTLTEVSNQIAILIVGVVLFVVFFGAKKLGIFHMNEPPKSAQQH